MRWTVEKRHRSAKQDLGPRDYQAQKLRGITAHLISAALAHVLVQFMKVCPPALKGASTRQFVRDFICTPFRVRSRRPGTIVLSDTALPCSEAI